MYARSPVDLDERRLAAAARMLGTTTPRDTIERALELALRVGDESPEAGLPDSSDPAQLCLLADDRAAGEVDRA